MLNFDQEFPLASLCDNYKDLDFSVCSPAFSMSSENLDLQELGSANAKASPMFLLEENGDDMSWTRGMDIPNSEGGKEEEEETE